MRRAHACRVVSFVRSRVGTSAKDGIGNLIRTKFREDHFQRSARCFRIAHHSASCISLPNRVPEADFRRVIILGG